MSETSKGDKKMKQPLFFIVFLSIILIGGFSGCVGPEVTETFNGVYPVDALTILSVSNINGAIEITGWNGNTVSVSAVKRSTSGDTGLRNTNISVTHTGNHLEIETKHTGQQMIQSSVDYTIKIPYNTTIESLTTTNGAIEVSHVKGNLTATSTNGAIIIENVNGVVSVTTSNGHIEVQNVTGIGNLRSSNAAVTAEIKSIQDNVDIETSNGAITIYVNPNLNATFEMTTSNAKIQLHEISLNVTLMEDTHVIGTLGTDGHKLNIRTSNAQIDIHRFAPSMT